MAPYSDFDYYQQIYLGIKITEEEYPRLSLRASEQIDKFTKGRASSDTTNTDAIKKAECAIADEIKDIESDGGADGITSETIGSSSVNYGADSIRSKSKEARLWSIAKDHLALTRLLYAGFKDGEAG